MLAISRRVLPQHKDRHPQADLGEKRLVLIHAAKGLNEAANGTKYFTAQQHTTCPWGLGTVLQETEQQNGWLDQRVGRQSKRGNLVTALIRRIAGPAIPVLG